MLQTILRILTTEIVINPQVEVVYLQPVTYRQPVLTMRETIELLEQLDKI